MSDNLPSTSSYTPRVDPAALSDGSANDGLEVRIARLEATIRHAERDIQQLLESREIRGDVREIRERSAALPEALAGIDRRVARINENASSLPGKGFIVAVLLLWLIAIAALLAFQPRLQALAERALPAAAAPLATAPGIPAQ